MAPFIQVDPSYEDCHFFTCCLVDKTMNSVLSLFNFGMLLFPKMLMQAIHASIEDEISFHLLHGFRVDLSIIGIAMIINVMPFNNLFIIHTVILWS